MSSHVPLLEGGDRDLSIEEKDERMMETLDKMIHCKMEEGGMSQEVQAASRR